MFFFKIIEKHGFASFTASQIKLISVWCDKNRTFEKFCSRPKRGSKNTIQLFFLRVRHFKSKVSGLDIEFGRSP